jgi:protein-tyrosine phosphatase
VFAVQTDIDVHTHIFWDLDDGPANMDLSITMARKFVESGTNRLFATPHGFSPYYDADAVMVRKRLDPFQELLRQEEIDLEVKIGMEVRYHHSLIDHVLAGSALCLGGQQVDKRFLLLELPTRDWPRQLSEVIYELQIRDITPIIAHPERNLTAQQQLRVVEEAVQEGAWLQLTAGSCTGGFGASCQKAARRFASEGWVHLIASDAHDPVIRAPGLTDAWDVIANSWHLSSAVNEYKQHAEVVWQVSS